ncbi:MAG: GntR family transcriptional regulator [Muribaculaceae bacterium]|nr:GntR family transcriptional regulator [Muribaculaceae bacterium]
MIELGKNQDLTVRRIVDFGAYLGKEEDGVDVLLPARYLPENTKVGDVINVFVYKDSEDRPIATTEKPFARVGEFAFLSVSAVNDIGAFMDWGLPKDLLVPFSEQKVKMRRGGIYPVYVFVDHATGRIVGSSKIEKFLGNVYPDYRPGQEVKALVYEHSEIGYKVIVDNLHRGMIYSNEIYSPIELEETVKAYVKQVREDGKIDLTLNDKSVRRTENLSERLMEYLSQPGNAPVSEKMSPEMIAMIFECSKKDFKKAVGHLYKERKIVIAPDGTLAKA